MFQKTSLVSTLRRLGEELYKPRVVKFTDDQSGGTDISSQDVAVPARPAEKKEKEGVFFKSSDLHTRMLSSLIILKTLTQGL